MVNYESGPMGVPWDWLLKSIDEHEPSHKKTLLRILNKTKSVNGTANYLGVSHRAMSHKLQKEGILIKKKPSLTKKIVDRKDELMDMTSDEIAEMFSCPVENVHRICRINKIPYKKRINGGLKWLK
jgi:hypothetical protein